MAMKIHLRALILIPRRLLYFASNHGCPAGSTVLIQ
jgi:hypothetical protein